MAEQLEVVRRGPSACQATGGPTGGPRPPQAETGYVMNDTKTLLTRGGNSMLMIDAANHDAMVALPPDNGDRAKVVRRAISHNQG